MLIAHLQCLQFYYILRSNVTAEAKLFPGSNQRSAFLCTVKTEVKDSPNFKCAVNQFCTVEHSYFCVSFSLHLTILLKVNLNA